MDQSNPDSVISRSLIEDAMSEKSSRIEENSNADDGSDDQEPQGEKILELVSMVLKFIYKIVD